jgi:ribosomal protein L44E
MANRNLTAAELVIANELLAETRSRLSELSAGDPELLFALRRKVFKELTYDERGKPMQRRALKQTKWVQQGGRCAECDDELPMAYSELDRKKAIDGDTVENTELVHAKCHQSRQAAKKYT